MYVTSLSPQAVLHHLHGVERSFGRARQVRWAPRTLDLDLLFYGDRVLPDAPVVQRWIDLPAQAQQSDSPDQLLVPHPRIQDRAFVLVPLAQIAPDLRHPMTGRSVSEMLAALPEGDKSEIRRI